jgi:hypothetical protein
MTTREMPGGRIEDAALSSGPAVQLAVDLTDKLRVANAAAEALFNLRPRDLGRPFQDLEVSYRPVELRSRIEQGCRSRPRRCAPRKAVSAGSSWSSTSGRHEPPRSLHS